MYEKCLPWVSLIVHPTVIVHGDEGGQSGRVKSVEILNNGIEMDE